MIFADINSSERESRVELTQFWSNIYKWAVRVHCEEEQK